VNPNVSSATPALITLRGGEVTSGTAATLTHQDIHAQNTFEDPDRVTPAVVPLEVAGSSFSYHFAPASVTCITLGVRAA
jgi:alpha-N-arabinofuranosidase